MTQYSFPQGDGRVAVVEAPEGVVVLSVLLPPKAPPRRRVTVEFGPDGGLLLTDTPPSSQR